MELNAYLQLIRRWLWLIILAAVIAGSVSFVITRTQAPRFRASTTIQVGAYSSVANPNSSMIVTAEQLAQTYVVLVKTTPVLNAVIQQLQLPMSSEALASLFDARIVPGTSLMQINVTYTNPVVANDIANEIAKQLIANSPTNMTQDQQRQIVILQNEITQSQTQLENARSEFKLIDTTLATSSEQDQAILSARRTELISEINTTQTNLAQMLETVSKLQQEGNINSLKVVEPGRIPETPIGSSANTNMLGAALVGAVLAFGAAFGIEYLNNTIRTPAEVFPLLNIPLLGTIAPFGKKKTYDDKLITWTQPRSPVAEAYRALRVNLQYRDTHSESDCHIYAVTSPGPSEGKSVTTANLAVSFALTGMRVLLIDTDLRRPSQQLMFKVSNAVGMSNLWATKDMQVLKNGHGGGTLSDSTLKRLGSIIQKTEIPGLDMIAAGISPTNPAELLGTDLMRDVVSYLVQNSLYDVILFDTPPVLVVSDSSIVASVTNAQVILVLESGHTNRAGAVRAVQQLSTLSLPIAGAILNRLNPHDVDTGYGYYYYGYSKYLEPNERVKEAG